MQISNFLASCEDQLSLELEDIPTMLDIKIGGRIPDHVRIPALRGGSGQNSPTEYCEAIQYEAGMNFLRIDEKYLKGSGLSQQNFLYLRSDVVKLFGTLRNKVIRDSSICYVVGPPGVGKSFATYVFICTLLNQNCVITWIYFRTFSGVHYVRFQGHQKSSGVVPTESESFKAFLAEGDRETKTHILVLDGFTEKDRGTYAAIEKGCQNWVAANRKERRFIAVTSLGSHPRMHDQEKVDLDLQIFSVYSWTKSECIEAAKIDAFFDLVQNNLDGHLTKDPYRTVSEIAVPTRDEIIESKFFFAGGCARYMFDYRTNQVISEILEHTENCEDFFPYLSGTHGHSAEGAVNHLLSSYPNPVFPETSSRISVPVSEFAATLIADKMGPALILKLRSSLKTEKLPSMDGQLFEMFVFAKLQCSGICFLEKWAVDRRLSWMRRWSPGFWPAMRILSFDPLKSQPPILQECGTWLRPLKWMQGGYDVVYVNPGAKAVTFVQITRSNTHSFLTEHFQQLLNIIRWVWRINIEYLDIYFLVPVCRSHTFRVQSPSSVGLFEGYRVLGDPKKCWARNELKFVKICSVDDF